MTVGWTSYGHWSIDYVDKTLRPRQLSRPTSQPNNMVGPSSQGETIFSENTGGPSGGSPLSGGGIIIFRVIRRHFLAAVVDPAVSLSMYSTLPMEVGR